MAMQDSGIFIASSLIADTPQKDKENAEPGDTPAAGSRSGDGGSRSTRKSLLGRRRSSFGRRLSGFGGSKIDANTDQSKLTSMYSSIIKLSSENKITREKCWGLHLIDYMDKVIMDENGQTGGSKVNFQKASCTLDASVKIYSHRVDATHMSSYSLLENLNRTDGDKANKGSGAAVGGSEKSTRIGVHETLKSADQLNQSEMDRAFEVDPMFHKMSKIFDEAGSKGMLLNNLNVGNGCKVSFDSEVLTEPPSPETVCARAEEGDEEKTSSGEEKSEKREEEEEGSQERSEGTTAAGEQTDQAPDNGQERGGSDGGEPGREELAPTADAAAAADARRRVVDVSGLRTKLFDLCDDLSTLPLCPQLQEFRDIIAEIEKPQASPGKRRAASFEPVSGDDSDSDDGGGGGFDAIPGSDDASFVGTELDGGGGGGGMGADVAAEAGAADDADPFQADTGDLWAHPRVSNDTAGRPSFGGGLSFIMGGDEGGGVGGDSGGFGGEARSSRSYGSGALDDGLCGDLKVVNDDYAFYEASALAAAAGSNNWAGASHWKFAGPKKKFASSKRAQNSTLGPDGSPLAEGDEDDDVGSGRKTRGKRRPPAIDFDALVVPLTALAPPKAPARSRGGKKSVDRTLLSEEYVKRALKEAEEGTSKYALPENAGFKAKDLAELFLRPGAVARRWAAVDGRAGLLGGSGDGGHLGHGDLNGFHDRNGSDAGDGDLLFEDANDGYRPGDDFDDDDDDESFHFAGGFDADEGVGGEEAGAGVGKDGVIVDDFEGKGLLSAGRRVEKIQVNYARKAKRVDVRRLKGDLWRKIDAFHSKAVKTRDAPAVNVVDEEESKEDKDKAEAGEDGGERKESGTSDTSSRGSEAVDMTFSGIVLDVASREEQMGVTVPFYFICLLHLANEKGLKLEGREDLLDFSVASDPVKEGFSH